MSPTPRYTTGPFGIRTKHGTLASIPYTVEPNDIPMMLIRRNCGETRS